MQNEARCSIGIAIDTDGIFTDCVWFAPANLIVTIA
jgi:hypothetical protein